MPKKDLTVNWLTDHKEHNYPAALSYLSLIFNEKEAERLVERLRASDLTEFKAKDIFRASGLSLLGVSNSHVKKDKKRIKSGEPLSPLLLVRDTVHGKVIIADGYHRLCAVYAFHEDALIRCRII